MRNRQTQRPRLNAGRQSGFSLIEFLVASAVGMIVLIAAGSTYFVTHRLNAVADKRLAIQQDLRTAADMIARDARQAGHFGCLSLGEYAHDIAVVDPRRENTDPSFVGALSGRLNTYGVRVMKFADFKTVMQGTGADEVTVDPLAQFRASSNDSNVLIFNYGVGQASVRETLDASGVANGLELRTDKADPVAQKNAVYVLSSCRRMQVLTSADYEIANEVAHDDAMFISLKWKTGSGSLSTHPVVIKRSNYPYDAFAPDQVSVSRLISVAYVAGEIEGMDNTAGLYRFVMDGVDEDGKRRWSEPQRILAISLADAQKLTSSMRFGFVRADKCGRDAEERFRFVSKIPEDTPLDWLGYAKVPALAQIKLELSEIPLVGEASGAGRPQDYLIEAAVRAGNVCANRGVEQQ